MSYIYWQWPPAALACSRAAEQTVQCLCITTAVQKYSQLYGSDGALVGAFQRMDIPILHQLDQYNYVLFTGAPAWNVVAAASRIVHASLLVIGAGATDTSDVKRPCPPDGLHSGVAAKDYSASAASLHSDCDVYFRQPVRLVDWGTPLPSALGLG